MAGMGEAMGPQPAEQQPVEDASGGHAPASPEEQDIYDRVMSNSLKIIYPEGEGEGSVAPNVLKALQSSDKPLVNVATTAVAIVAGLRDSAQKAGIVDQWNQQAQQSGGDTLDFDEILFHVGQAVVEELCEIAEAAKIHDFDEKEVETAFYMALDQYREQAKQSGALNDEALKAQWQQVVEADKAGRLGEMMPGIEGRMKGAEKQEAE